MTFKRSCYLAILLLLILTTGSLVVKIVIRKIAHRKQEVKVALSAEVNPPYLYTNKKE
ncbi:Uncharacterised protein [Staphylococcus gallinarum]|uniref:Uncharacterized protein n=1 Tax=Staphylococcus gallinarum TaxID=1293 RepID=A0A380FMW3_STAGA|nr:Uncharacterised protein [Staphylococcus gallinarum]